MTCIDVKNIDFQDANNEFLVNVGVSNRHLHVTQEHLEILFGKGYQMTNKVDLSQPGQFATNELVHIVGPKGILEKMRILGPARPETQIELALTDARKVGIKAPLRNSGDLEGTPGCVLVGPKGSIILDKGVIVAKPHIHLHTTDGVKLGIKDRDFVDVCLKGAKTFIIKDVIARVNEEYAYDMHIDTDEANAVQANNGDRALIIKQD